ncbi:MAG: class I SAM-dependent methyltransferase [Desulfurococcales archaeon]|nr:class I SAM-dependent methyltransferase [Desulfurococcales archaeon]
MARRSACIAVARRVAEEARRILRSAGLLIAGLRPAGAGDKVLFPVEDARRALEVLKMQDITAEPCTAEFEERKAGPPRLEGPVKGYTRIGDIAVFSHVEGVSEEHYRRAAQSLVREGVVRAVFLKRQTSGEHRVAVLEHLAGENRTVTTAKEFGLRFRVDIAREYYNPRLQEERRRVAQAVRDGWRVLDMFAGVGPFSIHIAAARRARILAVDINRSAIMHLTENIELNKKKLRGCITPMLADSRILPGFVRPGFEAIIMNNPTMTPSFLPVACKLAEPGALIFYYRVARSCDEAWEEALEASPCPLTALQCVEALDYAPGKLIYRLTLRVTGSESG